MTRAVLAIDPDSVRPNSPRLRSVESICATIALFQKKSILGKVSITSVYHPALSPLPLKDFASEKLKLSMNAMADVVQAVKGRIDFDVAEVLVSSSPRNEDHTKKVSTFAQAKEVNADLIVASSSSRKGLPYWLLGSFAETLVHTSPLSVLIIKPGRVNFSSKPRIVCAIDVAAPPSKSDLTKIITMTKRASASVDLIYVQPQRQLFMDSLAEEKDSQNAKKVLNALKKQLTSKGVATRIKVCDTGGSVAQTIVSYADEVKAWILVTTTEQRSNTRRLLIGSRSQQILTLTKRPFLNLR